ncbi:MAG: hypothetical protein OEO77_16080 [Acidimicrobiia bacterium]|nr:hypothetical protein [Acidimicrobiia bacterium]
MTYLEKDPVAAEVFLADGTAFTGAIYVAHESDLGSVHPMWHLLAGQERLIPCRGEAGELVLLGRQAVVAVRISDDRYRVPEDLDVGLPMRLTMSGGHRFDGVLHMPAAVGSRISDLLNYADAWLVQVSDDRHVWLASDQLVKVEAP